MSGLGDRVSALLGERYGGNVNRAARYMSLPQRTLARIASGATSNPHADVVERIAAHFFVSTTWLLSGAGERRRYG